MLSDVLLMLAVGALAHRLCRRINLLTLVGEIVAGLLIGPSLLKWVSFNSNIEHLAEIGVMLLLFNTGTHVNMRELRTVGSSSLRVALVGVLLPLVSGFGAGLALGESRNTSLFIGAALAATSIGITARVFSDLQLLQSPTARAVLGAAIVDDVLGLAILAMASIAVKSGSFHVTDLSTSVLVLSSFFAGVVIGESRFQTTTSRVLSPFNRVFILLFFVSIGIRADVSEVVSLHGLFVISVLSVLAFVSKYAAGFVARDKRIVPSIVGLGMVPRGEVGLIFANTAVQLGVFDSELYSSVIAVVLFTTLLSPTLLRRQMKDSELNV